MARILVVEDTPEVRRTLRRMLETEGHTITEAGNGVEAIEQLRETPVDLVITDILMPDKDGIELLRHIPEVRPGIPVIAMSGGGRQLPATVALSLSKAVGATHTLYKPFRKPELIQLIDGILHPSRAPCRDNSC